MNQLGGYGPSAMIGASGFDATATGVWFAFKGSRVANAVEIKIENDLYNVEFLRGRSWSARRAESQRTN